MSTDPTPRYDGLDRDLKQHAGLNIAERVSRRRWSPRRNLWERVAEFDQRAAELEQRQATVGAELRELHERHSNAPNDDAARLAAWELSDRKGSRPAPQAEEIAREIKARQADFDGLVLAIDRTFEEKVAYVAMHRRRLTADADREVDAAHERLTAALEEVAEAREQLVQGREAAVWAGVFPEGNTGVSPQTNLLAGGMRRQNPKHAMQCAYGVLGITSQLRVDRMLEALRLDAAWLKTAATPDQRALLAGRDLRQPPGTMWADSDDARRQLRDERQAILRAREGEPT